MGIVHQPFLRRGVGSARAMAQTKSERQAIEAAAAILADEESRMRITHAGSAVTSLPHKRIEEASWRRDGHRPPCSSSRAGTAAARRQASPTAPSPA